MAGALSLSESLEGNLLVIGLVAAVLLHLALLVHMAHKRWGAAARAASPAAAAHGSSKAAIASSLPSCEPAIQIDRLFAILEGAGKSAERAINAHAQASKHLDSAEYQLLRLFDEFPMLAIGRIRRPTAPASIVAAPASLSHALAA